MAAEISAELQNSEPMPICRKPIAPETVPAASGRMLMAPAAEFDITKALANITSIWVPNSQDGTRLSPATPGPGSGGCR